MTSIKFTRQVTIISVILFWLLLPGYNQEKSPTFNYQYFVSFIRENYGLFPYKNVDWDSLGRHYAQYVGEETDPDSLFRVLSLLAEYLKDKHVWLDNDRFAYNHSLGRVVPVNRMDSIFRTRESHKKLDMIRSKYLKNRCDSSGINDCLYGMAGPGIGYLSVNRFDQDVRKVDSTMQHIMDLFRDCRSLIIDIRNNRGGTDSSALTVANFLVLSDACYQIARIRKNKDNEDYSAPRIWSTSRKSRPFIGQVIVLINRYTISAAESFSLALKTQPHIRFAGEHSAGALSDAKDGYLPNGWHFTYSTGAWTDCNGNIYEEKGIQPDICPGGNPGESQSNDPWIDFALNRLSMPLPPSPVREDP